MAKTSYQLIPPEFSSNYKNVLTSSDRFTYPSVRRKVLFTSRNRKKGLTEKSLLPITSYAWNNLTSMERDAWNAAGAACGLRGNKLFLKDYAYRQKQELPGFGTPSTLHQVEVGRLHVEAPASGLTIQQVHPLTYWRDRKVTGTRNQYEPILITEQFWLPLEIAISWKTQLSSVGVGARARFYCVVYSHYQGRVIETEVSIAFGLNDAWQRASASISNVLGMVRGYTAYIEVYNARGDVYVDNVEMNHSGQNWARDPHCNDINQGFTKAFYQIPKHWVAVDIQEGAFFDSVYYD